MAFHIKFTCDDGSVCFLVFFCFCLASSGMRMVFIKGLKVFLARTCSFASLPTVSGCIDPPGKAMPFSVSAGQLREELRDSPLAHIYTLHKHMRKLYIYHIHTVLINLTSYTSHVRHTCTLHTSQAYIYSEYTYTPLSTDICAIHTCI